MKKIAIIGTITVLMLLGLATVLAAGPKKSDTGILGDEVATHATAHGFTPPLPIAGAEVSSKGDVKKLGKIDITVSASWDWGLYSGDHPCALMNTSPVVLVDHLAPPSLWTAEATILITTKKGDVINGVVVGGSVCELEVFADGTINEGLTSYKITGGTGKYESATGSVTTRSLFDSRPGGGFVISEIFHRVVKAKKFKGEAVGTSTLTIFTNPFETNSVGTYKAKHLGKGSYVSVSTQDWGPDGGGLCAGPFVGMVDTLVTLTDDNGDSFDAQSTPGAYLCDISPVASPLTEYESFTTYNIVAGSGTGKFLNASGTFTSHTIHIRPVATDPSDDVGAWEGHINFNK